MCELKKSTTSKLVRNLECFFEKASRSKLIGTPDRIRKVLTVKRPKNGNNGNKNCFVFLTCAGGIGVFAGESNYSNHHIFTKKRAHFSGVVPYQQNLLV